MNVQQMLQNNGPAWPLFDLEKGSEELSMPYLVYRFRTYACPSQARVETMAQEVALPSIQSLCPYPPLRARSNSRVDAPLPSSLSSRSVQAIQPKQYTAPKPVIFSDLSSAQKGGAHLPDSMALKPIITPTRECPHSSSMVLIASPGLQDGESSALPVPNISGSKQPLREIDYYRKLISALVFLEGEMHSHPFYYLSNFFSHLEDLGIPLKRGDKRWVEAIYREENKHYKHYKHSRILDGRVRILSAVITLFKGRVIQNKANWQLKREPLKKVLDLLAEEVMKENAALDFLQFEQLFARVQMQNPSCSLGFEQVCSEIQKLFVQIGDHRHLCTQLKDAQFAKFLKRFVQECI
ncbi:MAG: hypothetical protein K0S07_1267 [Chlamydiales bacterium]|jgi:hypothetical protein|nr:hypothetical protein [Chlamydiales bacterium]